MQVGRPEFVQVQSSRACTDGAHARRPVHVHYRLAASTTVPRSRRVIVSSSRPVRVCGSTRADARVRARGRDE